MKRSFIVYFLLGAFLMLGMAGACFWQHEAIVDLLIGRAYDRYANYETFSIEESQGKYFQLTGTANEPDHAPSRLFIDFGNMKVKCIDSVTIEDMKTIGAFTEERLERTGDGRCSGSVYYISFIQGRPGWYRIHLNGRLSLSGSPEGPFTRGPVTKKELIEIFGEPMSYSTRRRGWN